MIIVNKKPHFKKVPLLIFQFPSPPTLNNWLSHLLNLYSFVTYLYSSSIHFFFFLCVFSSPSSFSFFFSSHKAKWSRRMAAAAHFGLFRRLFRPESAVLACFVAVLVVSVPVSAGIDLNRPVLARVDANLAKSARINKKKGGGESRWVKRRTPCWTPIRWPWSHISAFETTTLASWPSVASAWYIRIQ